jgi:hypothetical protein
MLASFQPVDAYAIMLLVLLDGRINLFKVKRFMTKEFNDLNFFHGRIFRRRCLIEMLVLRSNPNTNEVNQNDQNLIP